MDVSDQNTKCDKEALIHQLVKVQAQITVTPILRHAKPKMYCVETEFRPNYNCDEFRRACCDARRAPEKPDGKCRFTVTQVLCIEIPIEMDVDVDIDDQGILCCGRPELGPCISPHKQPDCVDESKRNRCDD